MMEDGSHLHELLEALESGALTLERDRSADPATSIHRLFQSAHNLKSGLAMAGLERASKLFHGLEDGLDDIRRGRLVWSSAWADAVLEVVDQVRNCLESSDDHDLDSVFQPPAEATTSGSASTLSTEESEALVEATKRGQGVYRIEKLFLPGLTQDEYDGHLILEDIQSVGALVAVLPDWKGYSRSTEPVVVRYLFRSQQTSSQLSDLFFDPIIVLHSPPMPLRILIVDDDFVLSKVLQKSLLEFGEVIVAADGSEGLAVFRQAFDEGKPFDVVVLDLEMPEIDGHGTLEGIRDHETRHDVHGLDRCLVFMNTSNTDLKKVKASFRLQADRYFLKPLSTDQIKKTLVEYLPGLETRKRGAK